MANEATLNPGAAPARCPPPCCARCAALADRRRRTAGPLRLLGRHGQRPACLRAPVEWLPAPLRGLWVNIEISVLAVAIGTVVGLVLGALSLSPTPAVRTGVRWYVQLFRNAPILVLIYFTTYVFPFELKLVSWTFPFPDWVKVVLGLALPTSANVAEIFRGAIQSIPSAQWKRPSRWPFAAARSSASSCCRSACAACCRRG